MSRTSYVIAGALVLGLGVWLASGMVGDEEPSPPRATTVTEPTPPLVEVGRSEAAPVTLHIVAQGDVRAFRTAAARAETAGQVAEILVDVGERVEEGQQIARLTLEGRGSRLATAEAILEQRQADYDAAAQLLQQGFTTEARVRELRTQLESARQDVARLREELENTAVIAPFAGVVNAVPVERGEFVPVNAEIATLVDNSPLRVDVRVNQQDVARISLGAAARVTFATGARQIGRVCFVSAAADTGTRTFRVEVRTPNAGNELPSGISAEVEVPTGSAMAHFISPAILSLGPDGTLGVKTVEEGGAVAFHSVEVVRAQTDGVWVSNLPETAHLITVGQGFVQAGDRVRVAEVEREEAVPRDGTAAPPVPPPETICARDASAVEVSEAPAAMADTIPDAVEAADDAPAPVAVPDEAPDETGSVATARQPSVEDLQQALNRLGYDAGPPDGVLGDRTRAALQSFQQDRDLPPTGDLDGATLAALNGAVAGGGETVR